MASEVRLQLIDSLMDLRKVVLKTSLQLNLLCLKLVLFVHDSHHVVLDESRCRFGVADPSAQRPNELILFDGTRSVRVNHLKKLDQVHLINIHDLESTLELCVRPCPLNELIQGQLTRLIHVNAIEHTFKKPLVRFHVLFHLIRQVQDVPVPRVCECINNNRNDEVQYTENQGEEAPHKNNGSGRVCLNDRHSNGAPGISCYDSFEEEKIRIHD
mmetsp:Transcript_71965/g.145626  ORF Transcript_71965/g.145626 Transcript_71965/m.145626 type:complete len:214 (-) Transcript_71965:91-732(-)